MPYRRNSQRQRKYSYLSPAANQSAGLNTENMGKDIFKKIEDIPMPNELEPSPELPPRSKIGHKTGIIDFFRNRVTIEEIILVGLIFMLLDEGLNGVEDEFLLIMLVLILLT